MTPELAGRIAQTAWEFSAAAFLFGVVWTIRKARARGKRKFRDEPLARVRALHQDTTHDHIWDA